MTRNHERDVLLTALGDLPRATPDPARSAALVARGARTIAGRRVRAEQRMKVLAGLYVRVVEPAAACALSAAFLAAVLVQVVFIITHVHADFLWP